MRLGYGEMVNNVNNMCASGLLFHCVGQLLNFFECVHNADFDMCPFNNGKDTKSNAWHWLYGGLSIFDLV